MPKLRLQPKLLLFSVILALIPIAIAGRTLIRITQDELKSFVNEEVVLTSEQISHEIDSLIGDGWVPSLLVVRDTLDNPTMREEDKFAVVKASINIPDLVALQITPEGTDKPFFMSQDEFAERLFHASVNPRSVLFLPPAKVLALRRGDRMFAGDPTYVAGTDDWLLTIVLPLARPIDGRPAVLSARLDLHRLRQRIETHRFTQTGSIAVVDRDGRRIFDPRRTDMSNLDLVRTAVDQLKATARTAAAMPYTRPDGERVLGGYALPRYVDWAVVVERTESTAYVAIRRMTTSLQLWVMVGFVVAVVGAMVFSRRLSGPIQEIARVAERVGAGDFKIAVRPLRSGDEIAELGGRMNAMIEGLRERERVKSENAVLLDLTEKLRNLNETKNRFLGMAAHDLRNPIGGILGYADLLLEEDLPEEHRTVVSKIASSSNFMLKLLNDLLDISQIESGKLELKPEPTDLVRLTQQNVELNRIIAGRKRITVELVASEDIPILSLDPGKVEQVLSNLVSNAIKYSHPDTTVLVSVAQRDDTVVISVKDQGQGIPADELHKVFQEFQKTSVKSTGGERSTGLGLAIVKKIVEGHGGSIGVESEVGRGSTFYVSLPLQSQRTEGRENRKSQRVRAHSPIHFSVAASGGAAQAGMGTALEISATGGLLESTVPLRVGDVIRFSLRLPEGSITGSGTLVRRAGPSLYGLRFAAFDADGSDQLARFIEASAAEEAAHPSEATAARTGAPV